MTGKIKVRISLSEFLGCFSFQIMIAMWHYFLLVYTLLYQKFFIRTLKNKMILLETNLTLFKDYFIIKFWVSRYNSILPYTGEYFCLCHSYSNRIFQSTIHLENNTGRWNTSELSCQHLILNCNAYYHLESEL